MSIFSETAVKFFLIRISVAHARDHRLAENKKKFVQPVFREAPQEKDVGHM